MSKNLTLKDRIEAAYRKVGEISNAAIEEAQEAVAQSMRAVIKGKDIEYVDAYHTLIMTLAERVKGGIRKSTLERITREIKARNGKNAEDKSEGKLNLVQKTNAQKDSDKKEINYEQYLELRKTLSYEQVKDQFPQQDLRGYEGARGRYGTERTEKTPKRKMDGQLYRQLLFARFGTNKWKDIEREKLNQFDKEIKRDYKVPNGDASLRAYKAWTNPDSWTKK